MKILFVTQVVLGQQLGATRRIQSVARSIVRFGHELTIIAPGKEPEPVEGVRRVRPPAMLHPGARMDAALASLAFSDAIRWHAEVAWMRLSATTSFSPLLLSTRLPVALELDGRILDQLRASGRDEASIRLVQESLKAVVKRSKLVFALGSRTAEHARKALGAKDVRVIYDGVELDDPALCDRAEARAQLGLVLARPLVVMTGKLSDLRLDLLLAAQRSLGFALAISGQGPEEARVAQEAARATADVPIFWLGSRDRASTAELIRAADICISVRELEVGSCAEYAAVGRRFVAFTVEGAARIEALYPPGLSAATFVATRATDALVDAISAALRAEEHLGPLSPNDIMAARDALSWDHTARLVLEGLESIRK
ncbi:MAG: glycosyltransferase family 4 protein [Deltaproteobacteria bacterium]|nr:glycosyltransferase family 4 protein [Deltaproteobacteria bacterium]